MSSEVSKAKHTILVVLGSGGHTAEMCKIVKAFVSTKPKKDLPTSTLHFLAANTDTTSVSKMTIALEHENLQYDFIKMPRSREVGQSYFTSIFTTLWALLWSFWIIWSVKPTLVLCNGPGTCVPICIATYFWRLLRYLKPKTKIIFIESFCRTKTLSLTGRILLPIVDVFVVQWTTLFLKYQHKKNLKYFGCLM